MKRRHRPATLATVAVVMLLGACSPKPAPPPTVAPRPATGSSPATPASAPAATTPAPAPSAPPPDEGPRNDAGIEALNIAIGDFFSANGTVPKDLNELVRGKFLQTLPQAPPGKKFAVDPVKRTAKIVNQ